MGVLMLSLNNIYRFWRIVALVVLAVALLGPWAFDKIHVPAEYPCTAPFIRLEGDFCGSPLQGIDLVALMAGGFVSIFDGLLTGTIALTTVKGELLAMLLVLIFLTPFFSTLRLLQGEDDFRTRLLQVVVWAMASGAGFIMFGASRSGQPEWALWGLWLYLGIAMCALLSEAAGLVLHRRSNRITG